MIDGIFGSENYNIGKKMLDVSELRHRALSANLANVETPGYKRIQVDKVFEDKLLRASKSGNIEEVNRLRADVEEDRDKESMRADGNNVELDDELMRINQNAMEYEFLTKYVSDSIKSLNKAIRGRL